MFIRKLQLTNFKNHAAKVFLFEKNLVAFVGLNGVGKTNILDALYFLCVGKSYFSTLDKNCIKENETFFRVEQIINTKEEKGNKLSIVLEKNKRKKIVLNDEPLEKLSELMGKFPAIVVAPNDNVLVLGGSAERRKLLDYTLCMVDKNYLNNLIQYNYYLKQRNALLKIEEGKAVDEKLISIYNNYLIKFGNSIFESRKRFVEELQPFFTESFMYLTAQNENYTLVYKSHLIKDSFDNLLKKTFQSDRYMQRTSKGTHKDDIDFFIENKELKEFGSQGQQKTFILALKLSQYNYVKSKLNIAPIFIIDDIFDKLDTVRSHKLINYLIEQNSQVFISNTNKDKLQTFVNDNKLQIIDISNE